MANPAPKTEHLKGTQWQQGQSGNALGKPKGAKHLSTRIREMLEDDSFEQKLKDGMLIKGAPADAIIRVLIAKAIKGNFKAIDLLAKYGYGSKVDITSDYRPLMPITALPLNVNVQERPLASQ